MRRRIFRLLKDRRFSGASEIAKLDSSSVGSCSAELRMELEEAREAESVAKSTHSKEMDQMRAALAAAGASWPHCVSRL